MHIKDSIVNRSSLQAACLLFTLFLLATNLAFAEEEFSASPVDNIQESGQSAEIPQEASVKLNADYFKGYVKDMQGIVTSPARWDASDWVTATVVTGIAVGLYENDAKIQKWALEHKTSTTETIGDKITYLGFGKYTPVLLGGMYAYGYFAPEPKMTSTVLLSIESFVLTGVVTQVLKYSTHRHRPYTNDPPHTWDGPSLDNSGSTMSFPSGHASSTFAIFTVIASESDNSIVPPLAYGVATITALNRIAHNAHWASDVFVGSALGYSIGKFIVASHRKAGATRLSLSPMITHDSLGAVVTYRF
jgi:membrane-associated phospholipid phosphatase